MVWGGVVLGARILEHGVLFGVVASNGDSWATARRKRNRRESWEGGLGGLLDYSKPLDNSDYFM